MKAQTLEWNDVPFVLAVCRKGSLSAAARALSVNHSTVFRRIEGVESKLGVRLFERHTHGYVMTAEGQWFYTQALTLEAGMNAIELELGGKDLRLEGPLTITTTDSLLHCLTPVFSEFQKSYPDIDLRLLSDSHSLDLLQRQADIAIRPTREPPEHWVGRKIAPIHCAAYARDNYWRDMKKRAAAQQRWLALDDDLNQSPMSRLSQRLKPTESKVTIVNTVTGLYDFVRLGFGIAVLPCYLAERCSDLTRISEPDAGNKWHIWLLAHPDIRRSARVHAFFEFSKTNMTDAILSLSLSKAG
ncbi:MAG: LysR family transcriptional regulator [Pseudomonadota bacterium]